MYKTLWTELLFTEYMSLLDPFAVLSLFHLRPVIMISVSCWLALKRPSTLVAETWRDLWDKLRIDLRNAGWLRVLAWFGFCIWTLGLTTGLTLLTLLTRGARMRGMSDFADTACMPDGSFDAASSTRHGYNTYNYWKSSGFFQITLGFGVMSFTEAKILDISWDIVSFFPNILPQSTIHVLNASGGWSWWTVTHCLHIMASIRIICHAVHGDDADNIRNFQNYFYPKRCISYLNLWPF